MKSTLLAAAALLGSAQAGVHKLKLQKHSLAEQLVCFDMSGLVLQVTHSTRLKAPTDSDL